MRNNDVKILMALLLSFVFLAGCKSDPIEVRNKYYAKAQEYLDSQRYEEAVIEFRNALRTDGGHIPSYLGIAKAFQHMGDHTDAFTAFQQVIKLDGRNIEARLSICKYQIVASADHPENFKQARETAEEVLKIDPSNVEALTLLLHIGEYQIVAGTNHPEIFRQALETAEEVLKIDPSNVEALILRGNAYAGQNEIDRAIEEYEKAIALDPINLKATLSLAASRQRKNDPVHAEALFKKALENHPENIQAHLALAAFYSLTKRPQDAKAYLEKAFDLDPADRRTLYPLANFYLSQKNAVEAENVFKEAISRKPEAREPRWGLAQFYMQQAKTDMEMDTLNELIKSFPDDSRAQLRLAEIFLDKGDQTKAEEYIRSVLKSNSNDARAHYMLGTILRKREEFDKALEEFESAIKLDETLAPAYLGKANLLLMQGDLDEGEKTLRAILQRNKNYLPAHGLLAKLLVLRQNPQDKSLQQAKDALQQAQKVLEAIPGSEDALVARAEALRLLERLDESKKDWIKLCEMKPQNAVYWDSLGIVEELKQDNNSALTHFRKAVELKPDLLRAISHIVNLHLKAKRFNEALSELDRLGREKSPMDAIHGFRGQVFMEMGDPDAAEQEWRKTIELNPENFQAYTLLGRLYLNQNKIPQAIKEMDKLIAQDEKLAPEDLQTAYLQKASYLQLSKDIQGAVENYRKVLELDSQNFIALNNLAWLLADNDLDLEEALALAKEAKKKQPESPEIADTLGWAYYKMKRYTLAADQLLFSVNNRDEPTAGNYYRLGMAYYKKDDVIQAKQSLEKALELDDKFDGAEEARKILNN